MNLEHQIKDIFMYYNFLKITNISGPLTWSNIYHYGPPHPVKLVGVLALSYCNLTIDDPDIHPSIFEEVSNNTVPNSWLMKELYEGNWHSTFFVNFCCVF